MIYKNKYKVIEKTFYGSYTPKNKHNQIFNNQLKVTKQHIFPTHRAINNNQAVCYLSVIKNALYICGTIKTPQPMKNSEIGLGIDFQGNI